MLQGSGLGVFLSSPLAWWAHAVQFEMPSAHRKLPSLAPGSGFSPGLCLRGPDSYETFPEDRLLNISNVECPEWTLDLAPETCSFSSEWMLTPAFWLLRPVPRDWEPRSPLTFSHTSPPVLYKSCCVYLQTYPDVTMPLRVPRLLIYPHGLSGRCLCEPHSTLAP